VHPRLDAESRRLQVVDPARVSGGFPAIRGVRCRQSAGSAPAGRIPPVRVSHTAAGAPGARNNRERPVCSQTGPRNRKGPRAWLRRNYAAAARERRALRAPTRRWNPKMKAIHPGRAQRHYIIVSSSRSKHRHQGLRVHQETVAHAAPSCTSAPRAGQEAVVRAGPPGGMPSSTSAGWAGMLTNFQTVSSVSSGSRTRELYSTTWPAPG